MTDKENKVSTDNVKEDVSTIDNSNDIASLEGESLETISKDTHAEEQLLTDYLSSSILNVEELNLDDSSNEEETLPSFKVIDDMFKDLDDIKEKQVVKGKIVDVTDRYAFVDIGFKSEGTIPLNEFGNKTPIINDDVHVFIISFEDRSGNIILSKERADFYLRWKEIKEIHENDDVIKGKILNRIKGGMVVDLSGVQAFLPGSQVDVKPIVDFDKYVNLDSEFKIVKINELRQNIVLSRKAILADDLADKKKEILKNMEVGVVLEGTVKNLTDFGAFIDLGGIDGLLHITDITWGRINHPKEKLKIGETVKVKVIDFDVEKVRVSLGIKQLTDEPWKEIQSKYPIGSIIEGKIVNMMNYGAFIELSEGIEGLIHISEMSWIRHVRHPSDLFKIGDSVTAKILSIDESEKKISLGIKQLQDNPWDTIETNYPIGSKHDGIVKNLTQFGAFIELEEGIDGLLHNSDISWTKNIKNPKDNLKKGDKVQVQVLEVSAEDRKLSLGIKQLQDNPWDSIDDQFESGKEIKGEIISITERGVNIKIANTDIEGYVSFKTFNKDEKNVIKKNLANDTEYSFIVQQIDHEVKLIILSINDESIISNDSDNDDSNQEED